MQKILPALIAASLLLAAQRTQYRQWTAVGGGPEGMHYASLNQIDKRNVHTLEQA